MELPIPRSGHSAIRFRDDYMVVFGGIYEITRELNDCYVYNIKSNTWISLFEESGPSSPKKIREGNSPMSGMTDSKPENLTSVRQPVKAPIKARKPRNKLEKFMA